MLSRRVLLLSPLLTLNAHAASIESVKQEAWGKVSGKMARNLFDLAFQGVVFDEKIIALSQKQPEFKETLGDYVQRRVSQKRITNGINGLKENLPLLRKISAKYGVPAEIIVSFWGMESSYGQFRGEHNVIQSLATLIAAGRRRDFFMAELVNALLILNDGDVTPSELKGSWAGAMGQTQFMPSSYRRLAVDGDGDGKRNIWTNLADAFASTANYVKKTGWVTGLPWGQEIVNGRKPFEGRVWQTPNGGPAFVVTKNFDVIKRYNNADSYALCVGHLADRIIGGDAIQGTWPAGNDGLTHPQREQIQRGLQKQGFDIGEVDGFFGDKTKAAISAVQQKNGLAVTGQGSLELLKVLR
jgi:membrane-bound lytic murein transglycosylase B